MAIKNIINEIEVDVIDVTRTNFIHNDTGVVPHAGDGELTYERGKDKKGKKIETCVLYVDIRNSVALTEKHHTQTMGRIYTAFTKAVLKVARYHNGHTRNIIGDRIMIVFPSKDCYTNAIDCAISINHISLNVIKKHFSAVDFKCGIGIDFGELRVIKVGIQRNGTENGENKGLVWVGYPANIASRLTDFANKKIEETYYEVTRNPFNPRAFGSFFDYPFFFGGKGQYDSNEPLYLSTIQKVELTPEEFANSISQNDSGGLYATGGNLIKFERKTRNTIYPSILMTEAVFKGFKAANPNRKCILSNFWSEQKHNIRNVEKKIYGGEVTWELS